jgi:hypothetical protein
VDHSQGINNEQKPKGADMFGIEVNETVRLGTGIAIIFIGFLALLVPLFVYRISINVAGMRKTIDAMHGMIKNHIEAERIKRENLDDLL